MIPRHKSKEEVVQEFRIQSIQEATMRVIARKGMAAATMQEIAEEAGVAKGTIYLYFRDRDELVEKTFETAIEQLIGQHRRRRSTATSPFDEKMRAVIAAQLGVLQRRTASSSASTSRCACPKGRRRGSGGRSSTASRSTAQRVEKFAGGAANRPWSAARSAQMDPYRLALFIIEGSTAVDSRAAERRSRRRRRTRTSISSPASILDGIRKRS